MFQTRIAPLSVETAIMVDMDVSDAWSIDPVTLADVVSDRHVFQSALESADPVERLWLLRLLGSVGPGLAEARALLDGLDPGDDAWRPLLLAADLHRDAGDFDGAQQLHRLAWRAARSRGRQATTLHHVGRRWWFYGDRDTAASCFALALTMRQGFADDTEIAESRQALARARQTLSYDAIVLAGGRGSRLGAADKPAVPLAGWPLVDHVLLAAGGATERIVVGRRRIALTEPVFCREDPAGSGPVAAIAAAAGRVEQDLVAVLAADVPFVGPALDTLRQCIVFGDHDAAVLVDIGGRSNYLASMWRTSSLRAALGRIGDPANLPVRALYEDIKLAHAPDFDAHGADCDTREDLFEAEERVRRHEPGLLPAALLAWPRLELHAPS